MLEQGGILLASQGRGGRGWNEGQGEVLKGEWRMKRGASGQSEGWNGRGGLHHQALLPSLFSQNGAAWICTSDITEVAGALVRVGG